MPARPSPLMLLLTLEAKRTGKPTFRLSGSPRTSARHLEETGSTAGFGGPCWSPWLWFDIDSEDLHTAWKDAGALADALCERYGLDPGDVLLFFSGSKGFHLGLPTVLWLPAPSASFHRTARRFAENLATTAAVAIDTGVYDRVRAFRAPNSRHPKTGLHKRRLTFDELTGPLTHILELAKTPAPFDVPTVTKTSEQAAADWQAAVEQVQTETEAKAARRAAGNGSPTLNRSTLDFIRDGATTGDRHRLLFSAAANLGEFGCPPALAFALLEESALNAGLPPKDVRRQIECGLSAAGSTSTHQDGPQSPQAGQDGSTVQEPPARITGDSKGFPGYTCQQMTGATVPTAADLASLWNRSASNTSPIDRSPPPQCRCDRQDWIDSPADGGKIRTNCGKCGRIRRLSERRADAMTQANFQTAADAFDGWRDDVLTGAAPTFYPVGSGDLARIEMGPGLVTLFGGAPGAGKTAFVMQAVTDALRLTPTLRALVCNVEMPARVLLDRQLSRLSGIDLATVRYRRCAAEHADRLDQGLHTLEAIAGRLAFVRPPFDLANVAAAADAFHADLILLDYLQRIAPPGEHADRRTAVNATMDYLRQFADAGVAVLVVAAVGRTKDSKGRSSYSGDGLNLASFRESSELEFGADDAFILVPEEDRGGKPTGAVVLRHLKARHSEPKDIVLSFDRRCQNFKPADSAPGKTPRPRQAAIGADCRMGANVARCR